MDNPEWLKAFLVTNARQLGMAGKLLFPIPDRGLAQRLYRIRAKTLIAWGDSDKLIGASLRGGLPVGHRPQLVRVAKAGHMLPQEQPRGGHRRAGAPRLTPTRPIQPDENHDPEIPSASSRRPPIPPPPRRCMMRATTSRPSR